MKNVKQVATLPLDEEVLALMRKALLENDPVADDEIERRFAQVLDERR